MSVTVTVAASTKALTTAARISTITGAGTVNDSLILAASAMVVDRLGYELAKETVVETLQGTDRHRLILSRVPILSITSVTYLGTVITTEAVIEDKGLGFLYREYGWPSNSYYAPGVSDFPSPEYAALPFAVTYVAGFWLPGFAGSPGTSDVLLPIWAEMAAIELSNELATGSAGSISKERVGDEYEVQYGNESVSRGVAAFSPAAEALLAPHARVSM